MIVDSTARYHLERSHAMETVLHRLASRIRQVPMKAEYGVVERGEAFSIRLGETHVMLPIIGTWPLADLTPTGVADMLDALAESASRPSSHAGAIEAYAHEAVCVAIANETIQEDAIRDAGGGFRVELCLDEGTHDPFLWIATGNPDDVSWDRLKTDPGLVETTPSIPCHFYEATRKDGSKVLVMTVSCSDSEGIEIPSLRIDPDVFVSVATRFDETIDPVSMLRMLRNATSPTVQGEAIRA